MGHWFAPELERIIRGGANRGALILMPDQNALCALVREEHVAQRRSRRARSASQHRDHSRSKLWRYDVEFEMTAALTVAPRTFPH